MAKKAILSRGVLLVTGRADFLFDLFEIRLHDDRIERPVGLFELFGFAHLMACQTTATIKQSKVWLVGKFSEPLLLVFN